MDWWKQLNNPIPATMPTPKETYAKQKGIAPSEVKYEDFACWVGDWTMEKHISENPQIKQKKCYGIILLLEDDVIGLISDDKDDFTLENVMGLFKDTGLFISKTKIKDDIEEFSMAIDPIHWKMANDLVKQIKTYKIENGQANFCCLNLNCVGLPKKLVNGTITWA